MCQSISVNLSAQTRRELQLVATEHGVSMRTLVREILKAYLDKLARSQDE